jgi:hypothetical protein
VTDNDAIFFDQSGQHLTWDNSQERFELSSGLAVGHTLAAGAPNALLSPKRAYNYFSYALTQSPASGEMVTGGDLFVDWDFEAGDDIYYTGSLVDLAPGTPFQGGGSVEELTFRRPGARATPEGDPYGGFEGGGRRRKRRRSVFRVRLLTWKASG